MNIQLKYKRNQFFTKSSSVHNVSVISKISWTSLQNPTSCWARLRELTLKLREPSSRLLSTHPLQSWPAESHKSITRFPGCTADYKLLFTLWDICNLTKNPSLSPNTDRYVKLKLWLTFMRSFGNKVIVNFNLEQKVLLKGRSIPSTWTGEKNTGNSMRFGKMTN